MRRREIIIPWHVRGGIKHRRAGFPKRIRFFSGDVETLHGKPITLQLADNAVTGDILWINQQTILPTFLAWMKPRILRKQVNVCFFHYLDHDLPALLYDHLSEFQESAFVLKTEGVKIEVLAGKMFYAKILYPDDTVLHIIDTYRFYTTSLAKAAKSLGCVNVKYERPKGLGSKKFTPADTDFVNYALQDALVGWEIGKKIIEMHEEFNVPLSISAPQFAARVFTRYYLQDGETMPLPGKHIINAALASYHGGKNGFYVRPGLYRHVTELDISSAYPNAMRMLPQFIKGKYMYVSGHRPGYVGVYKVSGFLKSCRYSPFMSHEGKALFGPLEIKDLWITSFEFEESLRTKEFEPSNVTGWIWVPSDYPNNPLASYVNTFYGKKELCPKGDANYVTVKLLLNGLYGKFIQNVAVSSEVCQEWMIQEDGTRTKVKKTFKAGGLFNPFIATLITGQVRAYLHKLEHQYCAIHASTDSIKTLYEQDPASLPHGLGGLNVEVSGDCYLLRNKLYLHYKGRKNGGKPEKYALHGFWGKVEDLIKLIEERGNKYKINHIYKVREALNQGRVPLKSYEQEREVNLEWKEFIEEFDLQATRSEGEETKDGAGSVYEGNGIPWKDNATDGKEQNGASGTAAC